MSLRQTERSYLKRHTEWARSIWKVSLREMRKGFALTFDDSSMFLMHDRNGGGEGINICSDLWHSRSHVFMISSHRGWSTDDTKLGRKANTTDSKFWKPNQLKFAAGNVMVLHSGSKQSAALSHNLWDLENLAWKQFVGRGLERGGKAERFRLITS